jgi:glycosyltransferase involved in cell wall biosynthesis
MNEFISIVVPLYNEEGNVRTLVARIGAIMEGISPNYELVCINDGSKDGTLSALREIAPTNPHLVIVNLSRNFGHQLASTAGLDTALGDAS